MLLISLISLFKIIVGNNYSNDFILDYQINKINTQNQIETAFYGDSSCGNAIDSKLYGVNTINLSLVGDYIVCGSLELLKITKDKHPELNNIVIMHTLDGFNRQTFLYQKITNKVSFYDTIVDDLFVFCTKLITLNFKSLFINRNSIDVKNDYLKQNEKTSTLIPKVLKSSISLNNKKCILELKSFANKNNIEYVFLIGPSTKIVKNKFYVELITFFNKNQINFIEKNYLLNNENIGDGNDHVSPQFKSKSTAFYKELILKNK